MSKLIPICYFPGCDKRATTIWLHGSETAADRSEDLLCDEHAEVCHPVARSNK